MYAIVIMLSVLAGRYIELPTWQIIVYIIASFLAVKQVNRKWE